MEPVLAIMYMPKYYMLTKLAMEFKSMPVITNILMEKNVKILVMMTAILFSLRMIVDVYLFIYLLAPKTPANNDLAVCMECPANFATCG